MDYRAYTKRHLKRGVLENFFANLSITNWIILINVVFYAIASVFLLFNANFIDYIALKPSNILHLKALWTLLTSVFMHGSLGHLFVNMVSLMFIGSFVERLIGRKRFLWFYLISGVLAGLFFVCLALIFQSGLDIYAVGASGAIFALGGLLAVLTPKLKVLVFFIIPMPMWIAIVFLLVVLWFLSVSTGLPIGNAAHLGGLLAGVVYGVYLRRKYQKKVEMLNRIIV